MRTESDVNVIVFRPYVMSSGSDGVKQNVVIPHKRKEKRKKVKVVVEDFDGEVKLMNDFYIVNVVFQAITE